MGGDVDLRGGARLLPGKVCWRLHSEPVVGDHLLGVAAARQQAHHPVTRHEAFDSHADRQDFPGILHAGDIVGRFRPGLRIPAHALQDVRAVQRCRPDADEQVVRAWDRIGHVLELQDLGATGPGYHYCFHSSWSFASRV